MTYSFAEQLLLIAGMTLVTCLPRILPLLFLSTRSLNPALLRWLEMVPPAVLAALLAPDLLLQKTPDGGRALFLSPDNFFLLAALPTFLTGWLSKNFMLTVVAGMASVAALRFFFG